MRHLDRIEITERFSADNCTGRLQPFNMGVDCMTAKSQYWTCWSVPLSEVLGLKPSCHQGVIVRACAEGFDEALSILATMLNMLGPEAIMSRLRCTSDWADATQYPGLRSDLRSETTKLGAAFRGAQPLDLRTLSINTAPCNILSTPSEAENEVWTSSTINYVKSFIAEWLTPKLKLTWNLRTEPRILGQRPRLQVFLGGEWLLEGGILQCIISRLTECFLLARNPSSLSNGKLCKGGGSVDDEIGWGSTMAMI